MYNLQLKNEDDVQALIDALSYVALPGSWLRHHLDFNKLNGFVGQLKLQVEEKQKKIELLKKLKFTEEWTTFGKKGDESAKKIRLMDCSTEHLQSILTTQPHMDLAINDYGITYKDIIKEILKDRK